ncbi:hypothetical protein L1987_45811 [Smallanthus sonchifolius]|uniref:Uncharacterized protein n=1 Tax=Smallanthus sonchifolius TaxID=185202 RepID=A0ACB9FZ33_9ASTR|nr:hypothetical protein L1987_45811 [Smallanthus sonchifolius]
MVPSIDIYHRIRNPSMDEKVELHYRLRWLSQGSISKVPQSMVDASLELYPIPYSMLKLLCLSKPKKKAGRLGSYAKPEKGICFPSLSSEVTIVSSLGCFKKSTADSSAEWFASCPPELFASFSDLENQGLFRAFDSAKWRPVFPRGKACFAWLAVALFLGLPLLPSLRTLAHFQLGSLLACLALARNSQVTSPTQRREVVYLLSSKCQQHSVHLRKIHSLIHESGLEELEGIGFNPATGSPYGYLVANERPDLYSSNNLLLIRKKKEEKELGVGAYVTTCLLTKPSRQAPLVRL